MSILQKFSGFLLSIFREFPRRHLIVSAALAGCLLALTAYPGKYTEVKRQIAEPIAIVIEEPAPEAEEPSYLELDWKEQRVASGDNLSTLFQRAKLSPLDVYKVSSSKSGRALRNLYPGETFRFGVNNDGILAELQYIKSPLESHIFTYKNGSYIAEKQLRQPEVLVSYREGVIKDSLYMAGKEANLPDKLIMELANIFGWDIDFVFDIRRGDSFSLTYEDRYLEGEKLGTGNIIAASFTNRGKTYQAVRYTNSKGRSNYYTPEGRSMRKAFLRTPLDIFRISSGFNLRRKHPIHKKIKAHRGVDYAAPRGTPVYAAGDGKVIATGYSKPNGNYVFVQHGQTYTTKYLHLNRKKVRKGQTVRQRQLIGTVGSTGYATGPHLHYEFLVNGVHRNPRTVKLPQSQPIAKAEKAAFLKATKSSLAQLAEYQRPTQLASAQRNNSSAN
ncbi:peptidoglycan DD-metalloendopeptidase family protein [SAR92 clade bacterium H231]|jgi:murein DD-endopeptidase MepM/ murein hydrolase activator NlpD|nr:peptidoglycan DD-metalloendopeptidase family protein [Porticoccaceae bacterium]MBT6320355.1 peptidoglycan DD-metalloendopeptidase family protein [Porticoccaceae bacterium]MBT7257588.1 peptidoglycan DD-metalloendopeptidase family protein [Porticoccaceae bacterium]MBT7905426.1 peptidoglycan DD-metalloendopeptidase family protein [Porticoccaceae bacterium]MCT2533139.1 peptidoglycan DD-metalloendopeptidase family protein [SAR92 clade bacterium H231]